MPVHHVDFPPTLCAWKLQSCPLVQMFLCLIINYIYWASFELCTNFKLIRSAVYLGLPLTAKLNRMKQFYPLPYILILSLTTKISLQKMPYQNTHILNSSRLVESSTLVEKHWKKKKPIFILAYKNGIWLFVIIFWWLLIWPRTGGNQVAVLDF